MFFKSDKKNQDQVRGFSHLGENFCFDGEIDCKGEIEIAGKIKGNVKAKKLRILETGIVKGIVQAEHVEVLGHMMGNICLLYTSPSPRDRTRSRMPSSA